MIHIFVMAVGYPSSGSDVSPIQYQAATWNDLSAVSPNL